MPLVVGWLASTAFREDVSRLNRFSPRDWEWLRRRQRRHAALPVGKFNAGQKLNSALTVGAIGVMLGSGLVMRFFGPFPVAWRTGATFVHDWLVLTLLVVIAGHLFEALRDPESMLGIRTGRASLGPVTSPGLGGGVGRFGHRSAPGHRSLGGGGRTDAMRGGGNRPSRAGPLGDLVAATPADAHSYGTQPPARSWRCGVCRKSLCQVQSPRSTRRLAPRNRHD